MLAKMESLATLFKTTVLLILTIILLKTFSVVSDMPVRHCQEVDENCAAYIGDLCCPGLVCSDENGAEVTYGRFLIFVIKFCD